MDCVKSIGNFYAQKILIECPKIRHSAGTVISMKKLLIVIAVLGLLALAYYLGNQHRLATQSNGPIEHSPSAVEEAPPPATNTPVPVSRPDTNSVAAPDTPAVPLPALDQSDAVIREKMGHLHTIAQLDKLFIFDSIIRKFVVTVDNMTEAKLPQKFKFTRLPRNKFLVQTASDGTEYIDPANYDRYVPYVRFVESLDTHSLVELYYQYYPLFQEAYVDLGYPDREFNDRLIEVLDHLLATPDMDEPVQLLQPNVNYTFADKQLEALSGGQKLLIRIGPSNAGKIRSWLQDVRRELMVVR